MARFLLKSIAGQASIPEKPMQKQTARHSTLSNGYL